jgi:hypothetical protein
MEEAGLIEEASRRTGKIPAQFIKDAGLALASEVLDGKGRGEEATTPRGRHPHPTSHSTYPRLFFLGKNKKTRHQRKPNKPRQPIQPPSLSCLSARH